MSFWQPSPHLSCRAQDVVVVHIAVYIDVLQQFDLVQGLVEEVLTHQQGAGP